MPGHRHHHRQAYSTSALDRYPDRYLIRFSAPAKVPYAVCAARGGVPRRENAGRKCMLARLECECSCVRNFCLHLFSSVSFVL